MTGSENLNRIQNPGESETHGLCVFDIERFGVHDGPGLRTVIFLKGCPLSCRWCQNPEGISARPSLVHSKKDCIGCGTCSAKEFSDVVVFDKEKRIPVFKSLPAEFDAKRLIIACPARAIRLNGRWMDENELLKEVLKDQVFYRDLGGVTFSGGEPLLQARNLLNVLKAMKEHLIQTAIESSFYADWAEIEPLLKYLDVIYADLKVFDEGLHQKMTGVSNQRIKENLSRLLQSEHASKVIVRTPLIPGITDSEENVGSIAVFLFSLNPDVRYEMLNYNPLCKAKYPISGREFLLPEDLKPLSSKQADRLYETAKRNGIRPENLIRNF